MATKKKLVSIEKDNKKKPATKKSASNNTKKKVVSKPTTKISNNKVVKLVKQEPKKKSKRKLSKIINLMLSFFMIIGIVIMCLIIVFCGYIVINAPEFDTDKLYSEEASIFYDKDGEEIIRVGAEQRDPVSYDELPQVLVDAIVATEDSRFFQHNGFDIVRFVKATLGQVTGQEGAGGASTLTMQVAKNAFSRDEETGKIESTGIKGIIRKFNDIYISIFKIEKTYNKEEIIEIYVNDPFLGQNTYGVEQASQKYFGKSVSDLTLAEASLIAGIFNAPTKYNPFYSTELASERRSTVLDLMVKHGYITKKQAEDAKAISVESLIVEQSQATVSPYQAFVDAAAEEVEAKTGYNPYDTSMHVYTTMDPKIQQLYADLNNGKLGYKWTKDYVQIGSVVTDVKNGSILAINGGRFVGARLYNRGTEMKTQPGSTAKPIFAYGPYIEYNNGNTGSLFFDNKMTYTNGQKLTNADKTYLGQMTMRTALVKSRNIPAVQAFQAVDKSNISEFVHACGIDYGDKLYESHAIGGGLAVSPADMAGAYGTFARGGYYIEPYTFTKVIFQETDEVFEYKYEKKQAMSEETAYMITDMLISAVKNGVGGNLKVSGTEIAAKTGTSTYDQSIYDRYNLPWSASADNWLISYSPDYVISTWVGVDQPKKGQYTDSIWGSSQNKKISAALGNRIYKTNSKFKKPSGVVSSKYEVETWPAELPSSATPSGLISTELFKKGTEPSEVSTRFSELDAPTKGEGSESNGTITISWKGIPTPNAISEKHLNSFFNENYGQFATMYLNKRKDYNTANIGDIGYRVYLRDDLGNEQYLGFTTNTYYNYTPNHSGNHTFIVRSSYSIFTSNISRGLTITVKSNQIEEPSIPEIEEPTEPEIGEEEIVE